MNEEKFRELSSEDRRTHILDLLGANGKVKVSELSKLFNISEVTIRNDLSELEEKGALERTHGGAVSTAKAYYSMSFNDRITTNTDEKRRIAAATVGFLKDGDSVIFNSGTTTLLVAREMKNLKNLVVLTNSLSIAAEAGSNSNFQFILLGGNYNPQYFFSYGDDSISQLKKYCADKLILSVDGINTTEGITTYLYQEAELLKQMIERVNTTIVVADHTKIGRVSFAKIAPLEKVDVLITDNKASKEALDAIAEKGTEVKIVD